MGKDRFDQISIGRYWKMFEDGVLKGAPEIQKVEMKKAFYSGASTMFRIFVEVVAQLPAEASIALITKLEKESNDYFDHV